MKKLLRICLFLSILLVPQISQSFNTISSDDEKVIDLDGSLSDTSTRSLILIPINAKIGSNTLNVDFLYNVGDIDVVIYNYSGDVIYEKKVNTLIQRFLSIDVSSWNSDFYEIRFVSTTGNYMFGRFEIE